MCNFPSNNYLMMREKGGERMRDEEERVRGKEGEMRDEGGEVTGKKREMRDE